MRLSLIVICIALAGCSANEATPALPTIVVSVPPQAWVVERLVGPDCNIEIMVPSGANPTTHEPTLGQMRAVSDAALFVRVGHPNFAFERAWFDRIISGAAAPVVDSYTGIESNELDPHFWTSPKRMRVIATHVAEALDQAEVTLPPGALAALLDEIDSLDAEVAAVLAPHHGKRFFVFHAAWGYFAQDYGIEQVAIERGHMEPSVGELEAVIAEAKEANVTSIFIQPQFSSQGAKLVADAVGAELVVVDPLARDWPASIHAMTAALAREFQR